MFSGGLFWFVMGMLAICIGAAFKAFADDKGWELTWWKWLLTVIWYAIFSLSFFSWGTLIGEMEAGAGFRIWLLGMVVSLILGVGLWRILTAKAKA
jgi:hypothetical protein